MIVFWANRQWSEFKGDSKWTLLEPKYKGSGYKGRQASKDQTEMKEFSLEGPQPCTVFSFAFMHNDEAGLKHRTSHEPNRMQMRDNKGFFSFAFGLYEVRRLTRTSMNYLIEVNMLNAKKSKKTSKKLCPAS